MFFPPPGSAEIHPSESPENSFSKKDVLFLNGSSRFSFPPDQKEKEDKKRLPLLRSRTGGKGKCSSPGNRPLCFRPRMMNLRRAIATRSRRRNLKWNLFLNLDDGWKASIWPCRFLLPAECIVGKENHSPGKGDWRTTIFPSVSSSEASPPAGLWKFRCFLWIARPETRSTFESPDQRDKCFPLL